jgi:hypothetical protein
MTTKAITPLRQRMIEDMNARKLCAGTQRGHIRSCKRFAAFLKRSPETANFEDIRRFQLHLAETGVSICSRNIIMTGLRFLFRVTLRRLDLAAEMYHLRAPQKIPLVISLQPHYLAGAQAAAVAETEHHAGLETCRQPLAGAWLHPCLARPALISLLSLSMISAGVLLGAPTPRTLLAS